MEQQSFFNRLFDLSFNTFITTSIIKVLYILCIIGAAVAALFVIVSGFAVSTGTGLIALIIGAPLTFLISVIYARVMLEMIIALFRIWENTTKMANPDQTGISQPPAAD